MPFTSSRFLCLLPSLLALLLACTVAHAQIHEEKPGPGLEEGLLLDSNDPMLLMGRLNPPVGTNDFSVVLNAAFKDFSNIKDFELYYDANWATGWHLELKPDGALSFAWRPLSEGRITSAPHAVTPNRNAIIVVCVKRDARQPLSGIWVDGVEVASGIVPPIDPKAEIESFVAINVPNTPETTGARVKRVRVYNRALTRPEILELTLRGSGTASDKPKPKHPAPSPDGPRFIPQQDETIVLIGGTEAVALAESGELEALLLMAFPQTKFHFRCLAWEGDTVFRQDRPMNFGSLEQQLRRVNAGAVFMMFGRQECLEAKDEGGRRKAEKEKPASDSSFILPPSSLDSFKAAFETLLATVEKVTPNILVIAPPPFERMPAPLPDLGELNQDLGNYNDAMKVIARSHKHIFVGGGPDEEPWDAEWHFTVDGISLNEVGRWLTASKAAHDLWSWRDMIGTPGSLLDRLRGQQEVDLKKVIQKQLQTKNRLWHDYWRPSNWAFLHGDRTNQPSSRDPLNPQVRLFPAEQEKYLPLIKEAEDKIFQLVQEAQKKMP